MDGDSRVDRYRGQAYLQTGTPDIDKKCITVGVGAGATRSGDAQTSSGGLAS